jgi:[ribosomal protein S5]-alanine N-acetyltransferase
MQQSFTTTRLNLAPLHIEDRDFILELLNSDGWLQFIGDRKVRTPEQSTLYIEKIKANPNVAYWIVRLKDDDTPVGIITYIRRDYLPGHDLGFAFLDAHTGLGYAYEAARAFMEEMNQGEKLFAIVLPENIVSIRLLTKLGFRFEQPVEIDAQLLHVYST